MANVKKLRNGAGLVGSVLAASSAVSGLKKARTTNDKLRLANALASVLVAVTGILIAVRAFRQGDDA